MKEGTYIGNEKGRHRDTEFRARHLFIHILAPKISFPLSLASAYTWEDEEKVEVNLPRGQLEDRLDYYIH